MYNGGGGMGMGVPAGGMGMGVPAAGMGMGMGGMAGPNMGVQPGMYPNAGMGYN